MTRVDDWLYVLKIAAEMRCDLEHPKKGGTCYACRHWAEERLAELNPARYEP